MSGRENVFLSQPGSAPDVVAPTLQPRLTSYWRPLRPWTKSAERGSVVLHTPSFTRYSKNIVSPWTGRPSTPITCAAAELLPANERFSSRTACLPSPWTSASPCCAFQAAVVSAPCEAGKSQTPSSVALAAPTSASAPAAASAVQILLMRPPGVAVLAYLARGRVAGISLGSAFTSGPPRAPGAWCF